MIDLGKKCTETTTTGHEHCISFEILKKYFFSTFPQRSKITFWECYTIPLRSLNECNARNQRTILHDRAIIIRQIVSINATNKRSIFEMLKTNDIRINCWHYITEGWVLRNRIQNRNFTFSPSKVR